jgi:hypothetical protein
MRLRELRAAKKEAVDPLELPPPLGGLPWEVAQKAFGVQGTDFIGHLGGVILRWAQKSMRQQGPESTRESGGVLESVARKEIPAQAASGA